MRLVTKNTDYAVRALLRLARDPGQRVSARTLARGEGIPLPYLRSILRTLRERGLIGAAEGKGGGWELKRPPARITLRDLIRIFQGRIGFAACVFRREICRNRGTCPLRHRLQRMEKRVLRELDAVTIGGLMGESSKTMGGASRPDCRRRVTQPDGSGPEGRSLTRVPHRGETLRRAQGKLPLPRETAEDR